MQNIVELKTYIKYQLEQLSCENKHHEFEYIARHISRQKVTSNILPATGPVAGKGDQGRDFETFKSFIENNDFNTELFGLSSPSLDDKIVFACSLAKDDILSKIKSDIDKIKTGFDDVTHVYFFCIVNFNVADRHKIQQWCHENNAIHLEIFDGLAISELLTGKDLFWIAEHYLSVSADMYPQIYDVEDTLYQDLRTKWLDDEREPCNLFDLYQVVHCLKKSTFNEELRPDLSRWISKIKVFEASSNTKIILRVNYEICVATLRGWNNLDSETNRVKHFFSLISSDDSLDDLERTANLITYCSTAVLCNNFNYSKQELHRITKSFIEVIDGRLKEQHHPEIKCSLLLIKGLSGTMPFRNTSNGHENNYDLFYIFPYLNELLDIVNTAPLFPLEKVAKIINIICPFVTEEKLEEYNELTLKLDGALQNSSQGYLVAEESFDRATKLYSDKQYARAIRELHKAKVNWFSEKTVKHSLMAMLLLSDSYHKLKMHYPAIYYSMAIAYIANSRDIEGIKKYLPAALIKVCTLYYALGEWFLFMDYASIASTTFDYYADNESDSMTSAVKELDQMVISVLGVSFLLDDNLGKMLFKKYQEQPFDDDIKSFVNNEIESYKDKLRVNFQETNAQINEHFIAYPFSDVGDSSTIMWKALGITWEVSYENCSDFKVVAEELVYIFQIFQTELYSKDLLLLPTKVRVLLAESKDNNFGITEDASNDRAIWNIWLPISVFQDASRYEEVRQYITGYVILIIVNCSLLKRDDIMEQLDKVAEEGVFSKLLFAGTYYDLSNTLYNRETTNLSRYKKPSTYQVIQPKENINIPWKNSYCLHNTEFDQESILKSRYEKAILPIQQSLPRLLRNKQFSQKINRLKQEGYLDWQIISCISSLTISYRLQARIKKLCLENNQQKAQQLLQEYSHKPETEEDELVPFEFYSDENIKNQLNANMVATLRGLNFDLKQQTPDFDAIRKFLCIRCDYFKKDIPHENYLSENN